MSEVDLEEELTVAEDDEIEDSESPAPDGARRIFTSTADPTVWDLYDRFKDGDLILQPEFQRFHVWDQTKSSRLIESVLLEVPLPVIYLAEEQDGQESVIDGQQRLTAFFDFLDGNLPLHGLVVRKDLNGKRYTDLEKPMQATIRRGSLRAITIKKESDRDLKFEIFERLNTGAVALNDQELRNCVYRGAYNNLLRDLGTDSDFMTMLGLTRPQKRMKDVEFVLRFTAFHHETYLHYRPPMKRFLNQDMRKHRDISNEDAAKLKGDFKKSTALVRSLLGAHAFKRFYRGTDRDPNGYWEPKQFNASLYDVLMGGFVPYDKNQVHRYLDAIREALLALMTEDQEFIDSIELSTSSTKAVTMRFDKWRSTLNQVIGTPQTEPRLFTNTLKRQLFERDPTCTLCAQQIHEIDDAAVDHIEQYWTGGRTIPENARLTHRFCNWSRPRSDSSG